MKPPTHFWNITKSTVQTLVQACTDSGYTGSLPILAKPKVYRFWLSASRIEDETILPTPEVEYEIMEKAFLKLKTERFKN